MNLRQQTSSGVLDLLDRLQGAQTYEAIKIDVESFLSTYGFECFLISRLPQGQCENQPPILISGRSAADWLAQYEEQQLYRHDPVTARLKTVNTPFRWSDLKIDRQTQPEAWKALGSFRAFGKQEGLSVPIAGPMGFRGHVSMAGKHLDDVPDLIPAVQMMSVFAYGAVERISRSAVSRTSQMLAPREREVLRWIATGKMQSEVAKLLSISERTVEQHVRNARRKLGAFNTIHAVAHALSQREISL